MSSSFFSFGFFFWLSVYVFDQLKLVNFLIKLMKRRKMMFFLFFFFGNFGKYVSAKLFQCDEMIECVMSRGLCMQLQIIWILCLIWDIDNSQRRKILLKIVKNQNYLGCEIRSPLYVEKNTEIDITGKIHSFVFVLFEMCDSGYGLKYIESFEKISF